MRELDIGTKKYTKVICLDEPGPGNACHQYQVVHKEHSFSDPQITQTLAAISFQNGPVKEAGVNGCHNEDLVAIVIDRLYGFQSGEYNCLENDMALIKLKEAMMWLRTRTEEREKRGIEGTSQK